MTQSDAYDAILDVFNTDPEWVKAIQPLENSVVFLRIAVPDEEAHRILAEEFTNLSTRFNCLFVWGPDPISVDMLSEKQMNLAGWYRHRVVDPVIRGKTTLASELGLLTSSGSEQAHAED